MAVRSANVLKGYVTKYRPPLHGYNESLRPYEVAIYHPIGQYEFPQKGFPKRKPFTRDIAMVYYRSQRDAQIPHSFTPLRGLYPRFQRVRREMRRTPMEQNHPSHYCDKKGCPKTGHPFAYYL